MTPRVCLHPPSSHRLRSRVIAARSAVLARSALLSWLVLAFAASPALAQAPAPSSAMQPPDSDLVKVVILSRHGVRSPLVKPADLARWRPKGAEPRWPTWLCPTKEDPKRTCDAGELVPHGGVLAQQMGDWYRTNYRLFSGNCPDRQELYFWADTDQRTLATGRALLRGLVPECGEDYLRWFKPGAAARGAPPLADLVPPAALGDVCQTTEDQHKDKDQDKDKDTIFHPVTSGGACPLDVPRALTDMRRQAGDLAKFADRLGKELELAQCKLQCCLKANCAGWSNACGPSPPPRPACELGKDKVACFNRLPAGQTTTRILLGGKLRAASTFAELLLLEYGYPFDGDDFGFGRTRPDELLPLFRLHTEAFRVEQRTPYIARLQGSRLMRKIALALLEQSDGKGDDDGTAPRTARFVAYVGHDTNIANLGGLLEAHWKLPSYQPDQMPPAGALVFELRKRSDGAKFVRAWYVAQSPAAMHDSKARPPERSEKMVFERPVDDFRRFLTPQSVAPGCWN